jgi:ankyrin repeat protein
LANKLLDAGAKTDIATPDDNIYPLILAAKKSQTDDVADCADRATNLFKVIDNLIQHGAPVNAKDRLKNSALHYACEKKQGGEEIVKLWDKVVQLLLNRKGETNAPNADGNTPLHIAVQSGRVKTVKLLLQNPRTQRTTRNGKEKTAEELATDQKILKMLQEPPASVDASVSITTGIVNTPSSPDRGKRWNLSLRGETRLSMRSLELKETIAKESLIPELYMSPEPAKASPKRSPSPKNGTPKSPPFSTTFPPHLK